jgi:2-iminoacetate synthase
MSAGSKTNPGGYVVDPQSLEQFEISDERSAKEFAEIISAKGYEAVWKDNPYLVFSVLPLNHNY